MSLWMFLKTFGDCCLCFAILGSFPGTFQTPEAMFWAAVLCALGAGFGALLCGLNKPQLRFFGLLFPLAALSCGDGIGQILVLTPVIIYASVVILRSQMIPEYYTFREFFRKSLICLGIFTLVIWGFDYMESVSGPGFNSLDYMNTMRYTLLYAASGVLLMRQLRLGQEALQDGKDINGRQSSVIMASLGILSLVCIFIRRYLWETIANAANRLLTILMSPISMLSYFVPDLSMMYEKESITTSESTEPTFESIVEVSGSIPETIPEQLPPEQYDPSWILVVAVAVSMVIVLILMLRLLQNRGSTQSYGQVQRGSARTVSTAMPARRSPRGRIRQYYRDFLVTEQRKGLKRSTNQTSLDVLEHISPSTDPTGARQLREIYLKARYSDDAQITEEDAKFAKSALKKSRERR